MLMPVVGLVFIYIISTVQWLPIHQFFEEVQQKGFIKDVCSKFTFMMNPIKYYIQYTKELVESMKSRMQVNQEYLNKEEELYKYALRTKYIMITMFVYLVILLITLFMLTFGAADIIISLMPLLLIIFIVFFLILIIGLVFQQKVRKLGEYYKNVYYINFGGNNG